MEEWKDIKGYEGYYQISTDGTVRSLDRYVAQPIIGHRIFHGKVVGSFVSKRGYRNVILHKGGIKKHRPLHILLAVAFIENPENKRTVNHKDGNKLNNALSNLEWNTDKENIRHAFKYLPRRPRPINNAKSKAVVQCTPDGQEIEAYPSLAEVNRKTGLSIGCISIAARKNTLAHGYKWKYN